MWPEWIERTRLAIPPLPTQEIFQFANNLAGRREVRHAGLAHASLAHARIDVVKQAGGGSGGGDFGFAADAQRLNRVIDKVHDRAGIEERIKELRSLLAELDD